MMMILHVKQRCACTRDVWSSDFYKKPRGIVSENTTPKIILLKFAKLRAAKVLRALGFDFTKINASKNKKCVPESFEFILQL